MMDMFIQWPKPYLLLSATCDEILSWMVEIWMKNQSVSDSFIIYNPPPKKKLQGMTNNYGLTFSVDDAIMWFPISIEQNI